MAVPITTQTRFCAVGVAALETLRVCSGGDLCELLLWFNSPTQLLRYRSWEGSGDRGGSYPGRAYSSPSSLSSRRLAATEVKKTRRKISRFDGLSGFNRLIDFSPPFYFAGSHTKYLMAPRYRTTST